MSTNCLIGIFEKCCVPISMSDKVSSFDTVYCS